jgi:hypothetical protein
MRFIILAGLVAVLLSVAVLGVQFTTYPPLAVSFQEWKDAKPVLMVVSESATGTVCTASSDGTPVCDTPAALDKDSTKKLPSFPLSGLSSKRAQKFGAEEYWLVGRLSAQIGTPGSSTKPKACNEDGQKSQLSSCLREYDVYYRPGSVRLTPPDELQPAWHYQVASLDHLSSVPPVLSRIKVRSFHNEASGVECASYYTIETGYAMGAKSPPSNAATQFMKSFDLREPTSAECTSGGINPEDVKRPIATLFSVINTADGKATAITLAHLVDKNDKQSFLCIIPKTAPAKGAVRSDFCVAFKDIAYDYDKMALKVLAKLLPDKIIFERTNDEKYVAHIDIVPPWEAPSAGASIPNSGGVASIGSTCKNPQYSLGVSELISGTSMVCLDKYSDLRELKKVAPEFGSDWKEITLTVAGGKELERALTAQGQTRIPMTISAGDQRTDVTLLVKSSCSGADCASTKRWLDINKPPIEKVDLSIRISTTRMQDVTGSGGEPLSSEEFITPSPILSFVSNLYSFVPLPKVALQVTQTPAQEAAGCTVGKECAFKFQMTGAQDALAQMKGRVCYIGFTRSSVRLTDANSGIALLRGEDVAAPDVAAPGGAPLRWVFDCSQLGKGVEKRVRIVDDQSENVVAYVTASSAEIAKLSVGQDVDQALLAKLTASPIGVRDATFLLVESRGYGGSNYIRAEREAKLVPDPVIVPTGKGVCTLAQGETKLLGCVYLIDTATFLATYPEYGQNPQSPISRPGSPPLSIVLLDEQEVATPQGTKSMSLFWASDILPAGDGRAESVLSGRAYWYGKDDPSIPTERREPALTSQAYAQQLILSGRRWGIPDIHLLALTPNWESGISSEVIGVYEQPDPQSKEQSSTDAPSGGKQLRLVMRGVNGRVYYVNPQDVNQQDRSYVSGFTGRGFNIVNPEQQASPAESLVMPSDLGLEYILPSATDATAGTAAEIIVSHRPSGLNQKQASARELQDFAVSLRSEKGFSSLRRVLVRSGAGFGYVKPVDGSTDSLQVFEEGSPRGSVMFAYKLDGTQASPASPAMVVVGAGNDYLASTWPNVRIGGEQKAVSQSATYYYRTWKNQQRSVSVTAPHPTSGAATVTFESGVRPRRYTDDLAKLYPQELLDLFVTVQAPVPAKGTTLRQPLEIQTDLSGKASSHTLEIERRDDGTWWLALDTRLHGFQDSVMTVESEDSERLHVFLDGISQDFYQAGFRWNNKQTCSLPCKEKGAGACQQLCSDYGNQLSVRFYEPSTYTFQEPNLGDIFTVGRKLTTKPLPKVAGILSAVPDYVTAEGSICRPRLTATEAHNYDNLLVTNAGPGMLVSYVPEGKLYFKIAKQGIPGQYVLEREGSTALIPSFTYVHSKLSYHFTANHTFELQDCSYGGVPAQFLRVAQESASDLTTRLSAVTEEGTMS